MTESQALTVCATNCERCGAFIGMAAKASRWCPHCTEPQGAGTVCFWRSCRICRKGQWTPHHDLAMCVPCAMDVPKDIRGTWTPLTGRTLLDAPQIELKVKCASSREGGHSDEDEDEDPNSNDGSPRCYSFKCLGCLVCKLCRDPGATHCDDCNFRIKGGQIVDELAGLEIGEWFRDKAQTCSTA